MIDIDHIFFRWLKKLFQDSYNMWSDEWVSNNLQVVEVTFVVVVVVVVVVVLVDIVVFIVVVLRVTLVVVSEVQIKFGNVVKTLFILLRDKIYLDSQNHCCNRFQNRFLIRLWDKQ